MDKVFITGIRVGTTIGVYDHERTITQDLIIDLEMACDTRAAGASDNFEDALDYDAISRRTFDFVKSTNNYLLEAVAEQLADVLLKEFRIEEIHIRITKPGAVAIADAVGVEITRRPD